MWFRNIVFYRFSKPFDIDSDTLNEQLDSARFAPCSSQQASKLGWTSPMGKHSEQLVHSSTGKLLICLKKEEKILPPAVIKDFLQDKIDMIEQEQDRKVRKKEKDTLRDEITFELLPKAFSRFQTTFAYIDVAANLLVVDASSAKRAEDLCAFLRKTIGSLPIRLPALKTAPIATMTQWLTENDQLPPKFQLGTEAELKDLKEEGAIVRCRQQDLVGPEIDAHLAAGKQVVKVGLDYAERLSCMIGDDLIIRRLKFSDTVTEKADDLVGERGEGDAAAAFDADFTIMTLEVSNFIPDLLDVLGGEDTEAYAPAIAV